MTNIKVTLNNTEDLVRKLRHAAENDAFCEPLGLLADYLEDQLPKPAPAEPTGDVAVFRSGWFYKPGGHKGWVRDDLVPFGWDEIVHGSPEDLAIYRRELPQSDGAGALPTSPSPEVGVATSPPASSPCFRCGEQDCMDCWPSAFGVGTDEKAKADEAVAYNNGYEKGAADAVTRAIATGNTFRAGWAKGNADTHGRITGELTDLKPTLITAPEKTAIDKAIALIAADHEDTVARRGCPS